MKIIIAGAGEVGTHLAKMLSQEKQDIILMDPNEERLNFTNSNMEILPMVGNPTSIRDLEEAGIRKADLFVSVTPEETTNVAASILASKLGAHKTLARINNYEYLLPKNKELFENGDRFHDLPGNAGSQRNCHGCQTPVDSAILGVVRRRSDSDRCKGAR